MNNDINKQAADIAFAEGKSVGINHAGWVAQDTFGGRVADARTAKANARALLKAIDDGDFTPELPTLSGEWAGDLTPSALREYVGWKLKVEDLDSLDIDDLAQQWDLGVQEGFEYEICKQAKDLLS